MTEQVLFDNCVEILLNTVFFCGIELNLSPSKVIC